MRSTFHGLETGRRALFTHQTALHTTGHNIANANTPGYSRQRVNFMQTEPFPTPGLNQPAIPGQLGTGVKAGAIQRIREGFLDMQYRAETSKFGYWDSRHVALSKMEDIMNEPTEDGLAKTLDRFWTSLQDLSVHPEDSGARSVVRQRGIAVAETFNYTADSLKAVQRDMKSQINVTVNEVNSLARQINNLNKQIASVEPHGFLPNDLYDQRDALVDRLSQIVNVKVEQVGSGGQALEIAEGKYTIKLIDENGRDLGVTLVDGKRLEANEMRVSFHEDTGLVEHVYVASANALKDPNFDYKKSGGVNIFNVESFRAVGNLKADLEAFGYMTKNGEEKGLYPEMLRNLDQMVHTFVQEFNAVHRAGWNLNEIATGKKTDPPVDFFDFGSFVPGAGNFQGAASSLRVSDKIMSHLDNIAASAKGDSSINVRMEENGPLLSGIYTGTGNVTLAVRYVMEDEIGQWQYSTDTSDDDNWTSFTANTITISGITIDVNGLTPEDGDNWSRDLFVGSRAIGFSGDGSNALALANVKDANLSFGGTTTNVQSFYQGVIGDMAVNTNEAERMTRNADTLRLSVDQRRESVSGVSLDEEMTNLIQFQHAYNAAARTITMVDEMLDKIINGMGLVGR
ncbi:flagellar hook-associated protein FlgK [Anaerobacillus isosaccharinicus]|uniref:Flagellar hook-associated protein 1 n=1 Tax=Anaerobacillus isosaccharinicus TaxID=1532552 RepID=A0A1S2L937_9BACI|nr:flagellar hook-associated protein FlgK [Anaerobacillus isosaccharinicus]MBA5584606.1 flagellar hook-associated protein FlgK [Anaerobacillus isosaccharinicus]QOY37015.1 flagellar hook-associated protein FlgK [Anaerobacillus isosaccharinicus]